MGPERRQHLSGGAFSRAAFLFASSARMGALPHSNQKPLYVRIGHAPGRRNHGWAGKARRAGGIEGWGVVRLPLCTSVFSVVKNFGIITLKPDHREHRVPQRKATEESTRAQCNA